MNSLANHTPAQTKQSDFLLGLGIDTNFTIRFDFDSQACSSIQFRFKSILIFGHQLQ